MVTIIISNKWKRNVIVYRNEKGKKKKKAAAQYYTILIISNPTHISKPHDEFPDLLSNLFLKSIYIISMQTNSE